MSFDAQTIFTNLVEKERIKGHHSPEGRAIRTLSRALNAWSNANLSPRDVLILCDQAVEDWLKASLKRSPWSAQSTPALLAEAINKKLITRMEAVRLQRIRNVRARSDDEQPLVNNEVQSALSFAFS